MTTIKPYTPIPVGSGSSDLRRITKTNDEAKRIAAETKTEPKINIDRVTALKELILSGQYKLDFEKIGEAIVEFNKQRP